MKIGIPKEVKSSEFRVGATPHTVKAFVAKGHGVVIQTKAGERIGFSDEMYEKAGAKVVQSIEDVYADAEMIIKVKEPQAEEYPLLKEGQILFTYLHLAPDPDQTAALLKQKVVGIAYETVTDVHNRLPLLVPMSEVAGRVSVQAGATALQMVNGGRGVLLGGIPGVKPGKVVVLGGGIVGTEAMRMALGLGADVIIFDVSFPTLRKLNVQYDAVTTLYSTPAAIEEELATADLVIGAVLIPGGAAPKLITHEMVKKMQPGSVIVDVAIDQGGCCETSRPTTHKDPTYVVDGVVHYCVTNMPSAAARTATEGLTNATLPFALQIANLGYKKALKENVHLKMGLNVCLGKVTNEPVAKDLGYSFVSPDEMLK